MASDTDSGLTVHRTGHHDRSRTLDRIVEASSKTGGIRVRDLEAGDQIVIRTRNSVYLATAVDAGRFRVEGGWFRKSGRDGETVGIAGCTWGGSAIDTRLVAAPGMCLEFSNGVRTTSVQDVRLLRRTSAHVH